MKGERMLRADIELAYEYSDGHTQIQKASHIIEEIVNWLRVYGAEDIHIRAVIKAD